MYSSNKNKANVLAQSVGGHIYRSPVAPPNVGIVLIPFCDDSVYTVRICFVDAYFEPVGYRHM